MLRLKLALCVWEGSSSLFSSHQKNKKKLLGAFMVKLMNFARIFLKKCFWKPIYHLVLDQQNCFENTGSHLPVKSYKKWYTLDFWGSSQRCPGLFVTPHPGPELWPAVSARSLYGRSIGLSAQAEQWYSPRSYQQELQLMTFILDIFLLELYKDTSLCLPCSKSTCRTVTMTTGKYLSPVHIIF